MVNNLLASPAPAMIAGLHVEVRRNSSGGVRAHSIRAGGK
jgi:hypothetical protein